MINFFSAIRESFLGGIVSAVASFFGKIFDTVAGLQLLPLTSFAGFLITLLINAVCGLMTFMGKATIGLFVPDIGSGESLFETIVGSVEGKWPVFRTMSMTILALMYLANLIRIMTTPTIEKDDDTPLGLTAKTFIAGCLISLGPHLVIWFEKNFFSPFFGYFVDKAAADKFDFTNYANTIQTYLSGNSGGISATAQISSIASCLLILALTILIATKFMTYSLEAGERYVVLGILLITSPLAFCMVASKRTQRTFTAWVRMLFAELLLVVCNLAFLHIFLQGFSSFDATIDNISQSDTYSAGKISIAVLWSLLMYAILYVGAQMDTYLKSIGLNTAETGTSMFTELIYDCMEMGMGTPGATFRNIGKTFSLNGAKRTFGKVTGQKAARTLQKPPTFDTDSNGCATAETINIAAKAGQTEKSNDAVLGRGIISNLRGIPAKELKTFDVNSAELKGGILYMKTTPDSSGRPLRTVAFIPKNEAKGVSEQAARPVRIGHEEYVAIAYGQGAKNFYTSNPGMYREMTEEYGKGTVQEVYDSAGRKTGVWRKFSVSPDGKAGIIHEWAPTTAYQNDAGLNASIEHHGSLDYLSYDITRPLKSDDSAFVTRCEQPIIPTESRDAEEWIKTQFNNFTMDYSLSNITDIGNGKIGLNVDGVPYEMAPTAEYSPADVENRHVLTAINGAHYYICKVDDGSGSAAFLRREVSDISDALNGHEQIPFAQDKPMADFGAFSSHNASGIYKTAQERKKKEGK